MSLQFHRLMPALKGFLAQHAPEVILLLSFLPLVGFHLGDLWDNENYQYFPFVLAAVGCLSWKKLTATEGQPKRKLNRSRGRWLASALLGVAFLLLLLASLIWSPWVGTVGAIIALGAFMLTSRLLPEWLLLWLLVPLPADLDNDLTYYLQGVASRSGSVFLDFFGTDHLLTGYTIEVPGQRFLVEDACSGIHSLFVLIAFSAIYVVWQRRPVLHSLLLIAMTVGWALLINVLRISIVVLLPTHTGLDVSTGTPHEILGMVLFMAALGLLFCTDLCLLFLLEPVASSRRRRRAASARGTKSAAADSVAAPAAVASDTSSEDAPVTGDVEVPPGGESRLRWLVPGVFTLTLVLQIAPILQELDLWDGAEAQIQEFTFAEETLPEQLGGWKRQTFEFVQRDTFDDLGARSAMWTYQGDGLEAVVSFDYPFIGWHHLAYCYRALGWTTKTWQSDITGAEERAGFRAYDVEMDLGRADGNGCLLFCEFDQGNKLLEPPKNDRYTLAYVEERMLRGMLRTQGLYGAYKRRTYQFQVFCPHDEPLTDDQKLQLRQLYQQAKAVIMQEVSRQSSAEG